MNVLLAHFKMQDYGGIINYSEFLARGLKDVGCTVDSVMLKNSGADGFLKTKDRDLEPGWEYAPGLNLWMHQKIGWEGMYQFNYRPEDAGEKWESFSEEYDLIIYVIPVPSRSKQNMGDDSWLKLFSSTMTDQVSVIHDGNMLKLYPYILETVPYLNGVICVHDASYNSAAQLPIRRALIPNPHEVPDQPILPPEQRTAGYVSLQTFKRWKRVDDLVRATAYMEADHSKVVCGGGIEYHYMTSDTKCKKEYMDDHGNRIWDMAVDNGMEYLGYVDTEERDNLLKSMRLLVDPSWSRNYAKLGAHFNRVMVEAMTLGCVPVCTDLGMKNSLIFKPGKHYIEIPYDTYPETYATMLDEAIKDTPLLTKIQRNNLELVKEFDKSAIAKKILGFAGNLDTEEDSLISTGELSPELVSASGSKMKYFRNS